MWVVLDNIDFIRFEFKTKERALKETHHRVEYHNKDFAIGRRAKHYSQNAFFEIDESKQVITIKRG